jgi:hypothetical protein
LRQPNNRHLVAKRSIITATATPYFAHTSTPNDDIAIFAARVSIANGQCRFRVNWRRFISAFCLIKRQGYAPGPLGPIYLTIKEENAGVEPIPLRLVKGLTFRILVALLA